LALIGHKFLVTHCFAHRLQLAVNAAWKCDPYFGQVEQWVNSLFKFLRGKDGQEFGVIDLVFWSDVAGEDMVGHLGTAKARWLSLLKPLQKLEKSYTSLMAHLSYQFDVKIKKGPRHREAAKTIQWIFKGMTTWTFRFTIAGTIDILRDCFKTKNVLEATHTSVWLKENLEKLKTSLRFAKTNFERISALLNRVRRGSLTDYIEEVPATNIEACLQQYAKFASKELHIRYTRRATAGKPLVVQDLTLPITDFEDAITRNDVFERLSKFADESYNNVCLRFPSKGVAEHLDILHSSTDSGPVAFRKAAREWAKYFAVPENGAAEEIKHLVTRRDVLLSHDDGLQETKIQEKLLMARTLQESHAAGEVFPVGHKFAYAYQLQRTESAENERVFGRVEVLKARLQDQKDGQLYEQYLWVHYIAFHGGFV
jgi:hypothetical protein